jgi:hypothetical protein
MLIIGTATSTNDWRSTGLVASRYTRPAMQSAARSPVVALLAQPACDLLVAPPAVAAAVHEDVGRHGRPRQDSNLRTRLRRPMLYPLSYGGGGWRIPGT